MAVMSSLKSAAGVGALSAFLLGYLGIVRPLKYYARYATYVVLVIIAATYGVSISIVMTLLGRQGLSQHLVARFFWMLCRVFLGIRFNVINEGAMASRPAIFISNHQSDLDIAVLGRMFPAYTSVTAKKALKYYPFLGWFMALSGTVFLNRTKRTEAIRAFDEAREVMLNKRQSVFMFPEGTRSHFVEPGLLPFKKGAFHFAVQAQVPIVPYVVGNYSTIWSHRKKIIESGTIDIEVLDPIDTTGLTAADVSALTEDTRAKMAAAATRLGYAQRA